jgi:transcriptional regulator with XRE-family HTH domain
MITSYQLRAARALLDIDQRETAELADLSVPTIQRMEASEGVIRGNVDSLMKLVSALGAAGIELIGPGGTSTSGGRGVRLREDAASPKVIRSRQPKSLAKSPAKSPAKSASKSGASRAAMARER